MNYVCKLPHNKRRKRKHHSLWFSELTMERTENAMYRRKGTDVFVERKKKMEETLIAVYTAIKKKYTHNINVEAEGLNGKPLYKRQPKQNEWTLRWTLFSSSL